VSIATVVHGSAPAAPGSGRRPWPAVRHGVAAVATVLWAVLRRTAVLIARLIDWFAADPRRIRVASLGIAVCALTGAAIGAAVGFVVSRVVLAALGAVQSLHGV
jgi:hypothetical protein